MGADLLGSVLGEQGSDVGGWARGSRRREPVESGRVVGGHTGVMVLPIALPIKPMLAKLARDDPGRRRLAVRAEVGRVPLHRLPRRRRHRADQPQRAPVHPLLPRAARAAAGGAARAVRRRRRDRRPRPRRPRARLRRPAPADPPGGVAGRRAWPPRRRACSSPSTCSRSATSRGSDGRSVTDAPSRRCSTPSRAGDPHRCFVTPASTDRAVAAEWFSAFEGAGLDGVVAKRLDDAVPARQAGPGQGQAPAHRRLRGRRLPHPQGRPRRRLAAARPVRRRRSDSTTSASRPRSPSSSAPQLLAELTPLTENATRRPSVGGVGRCSRTRWRARAGDPAGEPDDGQRRPGGDEPVERRQGPVVGAGARRAGRRGDVRPARERPLPPRRVVRALAPRPRRRRAAATTSSTSPCRCRSASSWRRHRRSSRDPRPDGSPGWTPRLRRSGLG